MTKLTAGRWKLPKGKGEGSPIELALVRIKGAAYPKAIFGSTPTVTGKSHIEMLEDAADLTFRFT